MLYQADVERTEHDRYGYAWRRVRPVFMDASNKREARRLIREWCIIHELTRYRIGPAVIAKEETDEGHSS